MAFHLYAFAALKHLLMRGLVVPRLDIKKNRGFSDNLRFLRFFSVVGGEALLSDTLLFLRFLLVVGTEQINIVIILLLGGSSNRGFSRGSSGRGFGTLKLTNTSLEGKNKSLQVIGDFLQLFVLDLESIQLLNKSHVFAAGDIADKSVNICRLFGFILIQVEFFIFINPFDGG